MGEKPMAYFLGIEKRRSKDTTVTSLFNSSGRLIHDNKDILAREKEFFTAIYTEDPADLNPVEPLPVTQEDIPTISDLSRLRINKPFTQQDFSEALKGLNKNKSPGSDGITPEFYTAFWEQLKDDFMDSILLSMEKGVLTEQQRTGIITLLPKKDLDRRQLSNWRPITLLNTDLKIISKALALRIQSVIKEVVSEDQMGFIHGRSIRSNLLNIQGAVDYTDATQSEGILLAVDYSKAFNKIRWELIFKSLQTFGFGDLIIKMVRLIFKNIKSCVTNAGFSSASWFPSRGIRQGCCCSPSLVVLTVELMAIAVRKSQAIKALNVGGISLKISQYADDSTFLVKDISSLHHLIDFLAKFSRISGLRINPQKSYLLFLGNFKDPPAFVGGIQTVQSVKILGMVYKTSMSQDEHYCLNFAPRIPRSNEYVIPG